MQSQTSIRTTCPYCGVGCGILAAREPAGAVTVRGDPDHPANCGRLCSKGTALGETLDLGDRLLHPEIDSRRVSWHEALDYVAAGLRAAIEQGGPESVAFYVSGQLLTEDYYVFNKLMKGFIGAANIDTNSRLCMASSVAGHRRAFGSDTVPCNYADLEAADVIVLVGSNAAWCHPVLFQRIIEARHRRPGVQIVVIDPRRTATAAAADLHLAIKPGTDTLLFNGLLSYLAAHDALATGFMKESTSGFEEALSAARASAPTPASAAAACGVDPDLVARFYGAFAANARVVTLFSQGVNQSSCGTDKVNAIINCHLAAGRIGYTGAGPFSLTGQPNAMGGREVGGLANQLAAHLDLDNPGHRSLVQQFWGSPGIAARPGLKAVDLFQAVASGTVRAVWIAGTNPVVSMPDADLVRRALRDCPLVVVSDCVRHTDTTAVARVLLPALAWGEKDGTVTNSERTISRQRAFLPIPGEARPDWWMVTQVARRMGHARAFRYRRPADVFREHATLTGVGNRGTRAFDISALATLSDAQYAALAPVQWPLSENGERSPSSEASCTPATPRRPFGDGRFYHPDGRARFIAVVPRPPAHTVDREFPLALNTGRIRDQWHTMTRTGKSPRLAGHLPEPFAELHPTDAARYGVRDGSRVRVTSRGGDIVVRARVTDAQQPGAVFVPMHWSDTVASRARVDALIAPAVDPISGQPELKHTPVRIEAAADAWYGMLFVRGPIAGALPADWVRECGGTHLRYRLYGSRPLSDIVSEMTALMGSGTGAGTHCLEYADLAGGNYRRAVLEDGCLRSFLMVAPDARALDGVAWVQALFAESGLERRERWALIAGRSDLARPDPGRTICACFSVGESAVVAAIASGADSVEIIGERLRAGTNCGSCRPELRSLLAGATANAASAR